METPSRPRLRRLFVGGLAIYAICLIITAPASMMAWTVARVSAQIVTLEQPAGGLWRGRAASVVVESAAAGPQRFGSLAWDLRVLRLLTGKLAIDLAIDGHAAGTGRLIVRPRSIQLEQARLTFPAPAVVPLFPALQLVQPAGEIALRTDDLVIDGSAVSGTAEAVWKEAALALSAVKPLGTYRARLEGNGGPVRLDVTTVEGALEVSGRGTWTPPRGVSFEGVARARSGDAPRLEGLLRLLGPDTGNGSHPLRFSYTHAK